MPGALHPHALFAFLVQPVVSHAPTARRISSGPNGRPAMACVAGPHATARAADKTEAHTLSNMGIRIKRSCNIAGLPTEEAKRTCGSSALRAPTEAWLRRG